MRRPSTAPRRLSGWQLRRVRDRARLWLVAQCVALAVLLAVLAVAAGLFRSRGTLAPDLVGHWRTDNARYATNTFRLTPDSITYYQEGAVISAFPLVRIREWREGGERIVLLAHGKGRRPLEIQFTVEGDVRPIIRFRNQPGMMWQRAP